MSSAKFKPVARTAMRTSPALGCGSGVSRISQVPDLMSQSAFIVLSFRLVRVTLLRVDRARVQRLTKEILPAQRARNDFELTRWPPEVESILRGRVGSGIAGRKPRQAEEILREP